MEESAKTALFIKISIAVIILVVVLYVIRTIMKRIGLIKSDATLKAEAKAEALQSSDYFNTNFYKEKTFKHLSDNEAQKYAQELRRAMRMWGTNESRILGVFQKLDCKPQISQIAEKYYQLYSVDLLNELLSELRDSEKAQLWSIIDKMPNR